MLNFYFEMFLFSSRLSFRDLTVSRGLFQKCAKFLAAAEQRHKHVTHPERELTLLSPIFVIHTLYTAQDNNNNNNQLTQLSQNYRYSSAFVLLLCYLKLIYSKHATAK